MSEDGILALYVTDTTDKPVSNVAFTCTGDCSTATSVQGKVRLKLPPQTRPGDWVTLKIVKVSTSGPDFIMISPWDYRVVVPSFDNKADNAHSVRVGRRGDRTMLSDPKFAETMAARTINSLGQKLDRQISDEERRMVLQQQAESVGLTPEELDTAIRELGKKSTDPYQQGLTALYEKNYPKSTELLTQSYQVHKAASEKANSDLADASFFLGLSLYGQGKYHQAAEKFQEANAIRKDDDTVLTWRGLSLMEAGEYEKAEPFLKRSLEIREKELGLDHPDTAQSLNNLAGLYYSRSDYTKAEMLYIRALAITEKTPSPNHLDTATSLNNLAVLYKTKGDYVKAEPLFIRTLAIFEKLLGAEHPDTATSINNLAALYDSKGEYAKAEPLYIKALAIREKTLGPDHPSTATSLNDIAGLYKEKGEYAKAEPLYVRALAIREKVLGADHPNVATVLENYAALLRKMNRVDEAVALETRAKKIREKNK